MGTYIETLPDGSKIQVYLELTPIEEAYETRYGWCPPGNQSVQQMLTRYPNTKIVRLFFQPGDLLPTWGSSPKFNVIPEDVDVFVSFKTWNLGNVDQFVTSIPERSGRVYLSYHHEPEQGPDSGDPELSVWQDRWYEFVERMDAHEKRHQIYLVPVFTNYYQLRNDWRDWFPYDAAWGIDAVAFDVYNKDLDAQKYNSPASLLAEVRECATELDLPYLITEISTKRTNSDATGDGAAQWMYNMADASGTDDNCLGWMWFYYNEGALKEQGRITEENAFVDIIANFNPE